jgi:hypothetical protein
MSFAPEDRLRSVPVVGPDRINLCLRGRIRRADLPHLYSRTCADLSVAPAGVTVHCELVGVVPDVVAVEALAWLGLAVRRHRARLLITGVTPEMRELIALVGLEEALEV